MVSKFRFHFTCVEIRSDPVSCRRVRLGGRAEREGSLFGFISTLAALRPDLSRFQLWRSSVVRLSGGLQRRVTGEPESSKSPRCHACATEPDHLGEYVLNSSAETANLP